MLCSKTGDQQAIQQVRCTTTTILSATKKTPSATTPQKKDPRGLTLAEYKSSCHDKVLWRSVP